MIKSNRSLLILYPVWKIPPNFIGISKQFLTNSYNLYLRINLSLEEVVCHCFQFGFNTLSLISVQTALFTNCPTKVNMLHATALRNINSPAKDYILPSFITSCVCTFGRDIVYIRLHVIVNRHSWKDSQNVSSHLVIQNFCR